MGLLMFPGILAGIVGMILVTLMVLAQYTTAKKITAILA